MQFFVEDGKYVLLNRDTMSRFTFDRIQLRALARFILIELNVCDFFIKDRGTVWSGFKRDPEFQAAAKRKWGNEMEIKTVLKLNARDIAKLIAEASLETGGLEIQTEGPNLTGDNSEALDAIRDELMTMGEL